MNLTIEQVNHVHDFFLYIENFFDEQATKEIWGNSYEHYWDKWKQFKSATVFWQRLDPSNKQKLINWYEKHYNYDCPF